MNHTRSDRITPLPPVGFPPPLMDDLNTDGDVGGSTPPPGLNGTPGLTGPPGLSVLFDGLRALKFGDFGRAVWRVKRMNKAKLLHPGKTTQPIHKLTLYP